MNVWSTPSLLAAIMPGGTPRSASTAGDGTT
jgi:hypothetical protein